MVYAYHFSQQGRHHCLRDIPCQDTSRIVKQPGYTLAVVADGVGSCRHAQTASRFAVEKTLRFLTRALPSEIPAHCGEQGDSRFDETVTGLLTSSMNDTAHAMEEFVTGHEGWELLDFQTTFSVAVLYSDGSLFFANAGDSGILALPALTPETSWQILTKKAVDSQGRVYSLPKFRRFEIGKAPFPAKSVLCLTDGLLNSVVPAFLAEHRYPVNIPLASFFISSLFNRDMSDQQICAEIRRERRRSSGTRQRFYIPNQVPLNISLWHRARPNDPISTEEIRQLRRRHVRSVECIARNWAVHYFRSGECAHLTDDLSAAVIFLSDLPPSHPEDIAWEEPQIDPCALKARELSIYPSETARELFRQFLSELHPDLDDATAERLCRRYLPS